MLLELALVYSATSPIAEVVYHEVSVLVFLQSSNIAMESPPHAAPQEEESASELQFDSPARKRDASPGCQTPGKREAPAVMYKVAEDVWVLSPKNKREQKRRGFRVDPKYVVLPLKRVQGRAYVSLPKTGYVTSQLFGGRFGQLNAFAKFQELMEPHVKMNDTKLYPKVGGQKWDKKRRSRYFPVVEIAWPKTADAASSQGPLFNGDEGNPKVSLQTNLLEGRGTQSSLLAKRWVGRGEEPKGFSLLHCCIFLYRCIITFSYTVYRCLSKMYIMFNKSKYNA